MTTATRTLPGLDLDRLETWLREQLADHDLRILDAELIAGGKSNLTYVLHLLDRRWVLRRQPLGHVLATAHDMGREHRVMTALAGTAVPVPRTIVHCDDADVIGAPFFVMQHVEGASYRRAAELEPLGAERTRRMSAAMVDTLADIHRVDPASVGLADLGRPQGFVERQVRRWRQQLEASRSRDLPDAARLHDALVAQIPPDANPGIVHGDFRLDNLLVDDRDRAAAVIDWEMATLGDTLTDLALTIIYQRVGELAGGEAIADASSAPGFLTEDEMIARYAERTGADLSGFGFHLGLAAYKLTGILEGIHLRHQRGETVGAGFDQVGAVAEPLLASGLRSIKEHH